MNLFKSLLAGLALALCLFGSAIAGPLEDARAAHGRGDHATALALVRPLAVEGDADAQSMLGLMYAKGEGVPQDYVQAVEWSRKAADQGNARGQRVLGVSYNQGWGVPQDYVQAVEWSRKAADQGDATGQNNLGLAYQNGQGVPQDYAQAVAWYRKAADQGNAYAQENLGFMYGTGQGVPQDYVQAYKWYSLSAARMEPGADRDRGVTSRDWYAARLDASSLAQAQREASSWTPTVVAPPSNSAGVTNGGGSISPGLFVIVALLVGVFIWLLAGLRLQKDEKPLTADSDQKAFTPEAEAVPSSTTEAAAPVQKATPEAAPQSAISPPLPAEPPSADADLTPRPWVRFWAKQVDIYIVGIMVGLLGSQFPSLIPVLSVHVIAGIIALFLWALVEPLVLFTFQTTPGRALFRTQLIYQKGLPIPLGTAYERTLRLYIKGMGLSLPIISLVTNLVAYRHLKTHGTTTWDQQGGFEVRHGKLSGLRITFIVLIFLAMAVLYVVGVQMQRDASAF